MIEVKEQQTNEKIWIELIEQQLPFLIRQFEEHWLAPSFSLNIVKNDARRRKCERQKYSLVVQHIIRKERKRNIHS